MPLEENKKKDIVIINLFDEGREGNSRRLRGKKRRQGDNSYRSSTAAGAQSYAVVNLDESGTLEESEESEGGSTGRAVSGAPRLKRKRSSSNMSKEERFDSNVQMALRALKTPPRAQSNPRRRSSSRENTERTRQNTAPAPELKGRKGSGAGLSRYLTPHPSSGAGGSVQSQSTEDRNDRRLKGSPEGTNLKRHNFVHEEP